MPKKKEQKKVAKRWTVKERREDLKKLIREFGIWGLPSYRQLGERYACSKTMIGKDIIAIVSTLDPRHSEKAYFEFSEADKKIQTEMRKILRKGNIDQKIKASQVLMQLQNSFTDLDERYGKKKKIPDKIEVLEAVPKIDRDIKEYAAIFKKLDETEQRKLKMALLSKFDGGEQ